MNNELLSDCWAKEETKEDIKKHLKTNNNSTLENYETQKKQHKEGNI